MVDGLSGFHFGSSLHHQRFDLKVAMTHVARSARQFHRWGAAAFLCCGAAVGIFLSSSGRSWTRRTAGGQHTPNRCGGRSSSYEIFDWPADHRDRGDPTGAGVQGLPQIEPYGNGPTLGSLERPRSLGRVDNFPKYQWWNYITDEHDYHGKKDEICKCPRTGGRKRICHRSRSKQGILLRKICRKVGGLPAGSEDPSIEQISAVMKKVNGLRQPPYCDFSVFVPFAKRHLRAQKYQSFLLQEDGSFLSKMVPGPENFGHWQASFRVMRTTFIMTGVISLSNLMQWEAHIEKLNRQFPNCWGLIAAADYRGRGEFMNKTLAKMRMEIDLGGQPPPGWNLDKPWDMVWARVLKDRDFWNEQVYLPAVSWTARGSRGRPLTPMEEEAKVGLRGGHQALQPEQEEVQDGVDNPRKRSNRVRREARKKRMRAEREELENFRANRRPNGKGWRWKRLQRKEWKSRGGVLRLEQREWFVWRTTTRRKVQRENPSSPQMHDLQIGGPPVTRMPPETEQDMTFVKFIFYLGKRRGEGDKRIAKEQKEEKKEAPDRSGVRRNLDDKNSTKRKIHAGDDPSDDEDPRPGKVHYRGNFLTFEEFLQERTFLFIHHFSGRTDNLSKAVKEESEKLGLTVHTTNP